MDKTGFLDYLNTRFPSGKEVIVTYISWNVLYDIAEHAMDNGVDTLDSYLSILSTVIQVPANRGFQDIKDELCELFGGKYPFSAEDVFPDTETYFDYYNAYEEKQNSRRWSELNKCTQESIRRQRACRVTGLKSVRDAVFRKDGHKCVFCGSGDDLTVDHIVPVSLGGSDEFSNFQTLCRRCNSGKGSNLVPHPGGKG